MSVYQIIRLEGLIKMHSKTLICLEILSDPENSGLDRFHCTMKYGKEKN